MYMYRIGHSITLTNWLTAKIQNCEKQRERKKERGRERKGKRDKLFGRLSKQQQ